MATRAKVALLIETSRGYGRGLLRGIIRYGREHGPWAYHLTPGDFRQELPRLKQWGATGIIARIESRRMAREILDCDVPTIVLEPEPELLTPKQWKKVSQVYPDPEIIARRAFDHLFLKGFSHFAYCGLPDRIWSSERQREFARCVERSGGRCMVYPLPRLKRDRAWSQEERILADWLKALPKPVGIMTCTDVRGRQVLEACRRAELIVPDEVAVVGTDNDELVCELCDPPLSSVAIDTETAGYQAAELLGRLMGGRYRKPGKLISKATHVVERQSTDVLAMEDRIVAEALRFIRQPHSHPIAVQDILQVVPLSRRALEIRFRKAIGRTIHEELQHQRMTRAARLLLETDLSVASIAERAGFSSASYMTAVFRRYFGKTPLQYRKKP